MSISARKNTFQPRHFCIVAHAVEVDGWLLPSGGRSAKCLSAISITVTDKELVNYIVRTMVLTVPASSTDRADRSMVYLIETMPRGGT